MRPFFRDSYFVWLLTVVIVLIANGPAQAHRPYFKQVRPILLPDGRQGEMRIIAGDGIIMADPVRIVIINEESRLVARGPQVRWLSLICKVPRRCYAYDHESSEIIAPDPTSFSKDGSVVPAAGERDGLWEIEGGEAVWGVTVRPATWREWVSAEGTAFLAAWPWSQAFYGILGMLAGFCFVGFQAPGRTGLQFLLWLGGLALRLVLFAAATLVLMIAAIMSDTVPIVMFGSILLGLFLAFLLGPMTLRRFRSAFASR